ncbi:tRNA (cytosine(72)-C(5))-methyltransferase NSUN6-like [Homarus americanus]|uniref:Methyltransferase-like 3 n=1 Tax=Homarus americanus TaxID=6706 RepID=A0A8J5MJE0_HOMAM|nr:tRNA (cytosine(72)-C(5))-methyltransferase NSUN6-like [Homarus americanus]XP_042209088.1 tRNA (cytosine(72)-C(5))-methyltransferase NSUN6-like [Homarus americanus]XP_042209089.1 tRNA (cytosine(72)-C(5))-methyltransferase NSUN6-like [Homarus americanus]XP_042209090.1 tRNA (cytosine(72)-C(5))-methyltransferase NSUN6-like [Homarus americanus]KAG7153634.1 methyltransferase-like 3 [Homarus americanus]
MAGAECLSSKEQYILGEFNPLLPEVTDYLRKSLRSVTHNYDNEASKNQEDNTCIKKPFITDFNEFHHDIDKALTSLSLPPRFTTVRVNLLKTNVSEAVALVEEQLRLQHVGKSTPLPLVYQHHKLPDLLVVESHGIQKVKPATKEVVVGRMCGSAVLRGAEVFAPGVLGATPDLQVGDAVAVFADLNDTCLRGCKDFRGSKMFLGNGTALQSRKELFQASKSTGVAVSMKEQIFDSPSLGSCHLNLLFLQNLPSVLCGHILNPSKHMKVLDMCAAPGGKTTHIAMLMCNTGQVIAVDRSHNKIEQIRSNAHRLSLTNITAYKYDSTNLILTSDDKNLKSDEEKGGEVFNKIPSNINVDKICSELANSAEDLKFSSPAPPYAPSSFKWILLDAPCSGLGQRPQSHTKTNIKELHSFPVVQRKLLKTAVELLEPGGKLVYSTCTIVTEENEKMVKWLLDKFPNVELINTTPKLGKPGLPHCGLTKEQCEKVQRFGPFPYTNVHVQHVDEDTIGFFVAAFKKLC